MKKLLLMTLLLATTITKGQIALEHFYPANFSFSFVRLSLTDNKWAVIDTNTITLYNLNHSFYKTISIVGAPVEPTDVLYISKGLFDTDTTTIEYMIDKRDVRETRIFREDGTILFSEDFCSADFGSYSGNPVRPAWSPIIISSSGPKMILHTIDSSTYQPNGFKVYSLPGVYYPSMVARLNNTENLMELSNPFPNPSSNSTKIGYTIPAGEKNVEIVLYRMNGTEAKRFQVDNRFDTLELNNSDLPAGTYFYQLVSKNQQSASKKMVVIK